MTDKCVREVTPGSGKVEDAIKVMIKEKKNNEQQLYAL